MALNSPEEPKGKTIAVPTGDLEQVKAGLRNIQINGGINASSESARLGIGGIVIPRGQRTQEADLKRTTGSESDTPALPAPTEPPSNVNVLARQDTASVPAENKTILSVGSGDQGYQELQKQAALADAKFGTKQQAVQPPVERVGQVMPPDSSHPKPWIKVGRVGSLGDNHIEVDTVMESRQRTFEPQPLYESGKAPLVDVSHVGNVRSHGPIDTNKAVENKSVINVVVSQAKKILKSILPSPKNTRPPQAIPQPGK